VPVTPERVSAERARLGLDRPLPERYVRGLVAAAHGDLGVSVRSGRPVGEEVAVRLGPTLRLAAAGGVVAVVVGLAIGLGEAALRGRSAGPALRAASLVLVCVPPFALAFALVAVFSLGLGWLPTQGTRGARALVLPALVLGLPAGAAIGRVLFTRLREVLAEPYLVTAAAQGEPAAARLLLWALPNAAVTTLVAGGNVLAGVASGTLVVERLFGWPGLGAYLIDALQYRDWYPLQASVLVLAMLIVAVRGLTLMVAAVLDPRARVTA
jgi:peptide/nickel transport system permease protein